MVDTVKVYGTTLAAEHVYFEILEKLLENGGKSIDAMLEVAEKQYVFGIEPPGWGQYFEDTINKVAIYPDKVCLEAYPGGFNETFACGWPTGVVQDSRLSLGDYFAKVRELCEEVGGSPEVYKEHGVPTLWCSLPDKKAFEEFVKKVNRRARPISDFKIIAELK